MNLLPNEVRRKFRAISNMMGKFSQNHMRAMTQRVIENGLLDDEWKQSRKAVFMHTPKG